MKLHIRKFRFCDNIAQIIIWLKHSLNEAVCNEANTDDVFIFK